MFGRRADASPAQVPSHLRRLMPHLSPRRNDSLVTMMQEIRVDPALVYLEEKNRSRPEGRPMTLFHLFLRSLSVGMELRPGVNRFVKGRRLWQRDGVYLTFSAKRELVDGSPLLTVKRRFCSDDETVFDMVDAIYDKLLASRAGKETASDREVNLLLRLPGFLVPVVMGVARIADELGLLPRAMIESDPLFTSAFCANLGSIELPAGFHHLWEYGTASVFAVLGRIETRPDGSRVLPVGWTYDERIEDGMYCYYTLEGIRSRIEEPELLERSASQLAEGS
ncbi:2-oxo acid dehydrogenase subunit E2 [Myxococcota bacterium]|nr:2-oxo acid dehydrogenase subunit E2 [Myxococcota bacterium]